MVCLIKVKLSFTSAPKFFAILITRRNIEHQKEYYILWDLRTKTCILQCFGSPIIAKNVSARSEKNSCPAMTF